MHQEPVIGLLDAKIEEYRALRAGLIQHIENYRNWLSRSEQTDAVKELRLYDILQTLEHDQLVVAFLAEFSRGKTETINALFFSDFNQRLLPSEAGRTTMCPTEILWDAHDEPCMKLLPIETRLTKDSLTYLKTTPKIWHKFRLDTNSPEQMVATLRKLVDQKSVTKQEAEALGLWNPEDIGMEQDLHATGMVQIPLWRHAVINYPHPMLKNGLVILDTPGLNALGAEPELTLNIIPSAHAVIFLTAADSGITKSDLKIWNEYVKSRANYKLAVLNKVDILWDDLKSAQQIKNEIDRQVNIASHQLGVSPENVFAVSAQKALAAKIKKDPVLLENSGIKQLERVLGEQIIKAKQEILGRTAASECSEMIKLSRKVLQLRLQDLRSQMLELRTLRGLTIDNSRHILAQVVAERKRYEAAIPTFNQAQGKISQIGNKLLRHLSIAYLDASISQSREDMGDSWTTVGLNQSMRNLMRQAIDLASHIKNESETIKKLAGNIYEVFQSRHGFRVIAPPALDMSVFLSNMQALEKITDDFCKDPVNVLTEKRFLIRRFFLGLGTQSQRIFEQAEKDCKQWLEDVMGLLQQQIETNRRNLEERAANLMQAKANAEALDFKLAEIERQYNLVAKEAQALDEMLLYMVKALKPAKKAMQAEKTFSLGKHMNLPDMPFLSAMSNAEAHAGT
ncbi:MAG TPA: dynamin family protein [Methylophilus sp.]|nr:dynamin family protein [Methylophilus sp.]HQQ33085.1 dynamin family protein [Methylophilus sp.]